MNPTFEPCICTTSTIFAAPVELSALTPVISPGLKLPVLVATPPVVTNAVLKSSVIAVSDTFFAISSEFGLHTTTGARFCKQLINSCHDCPTASQVAVHFCSPKTWGFAPLQQAYRSQKASGFEHPSLVITQDALRPKGESNGYWDHRPQHLRSEANGTTVGKTVGVVTLTEYHGVPPPVVKVKG